MDAIKLIEQKCRDRGVSLSKVCKELGLKSMYFSRWKKTPPIVIQYIEKVNKHLDRLE